MPSTQSRWIKGTPTMGKWTQEAGKRYGYNDVYHLATGRLDEEDVVVAIARLRNRKYDCPVALRK